MSISAQRRLVIGTLASIWLAATPAIAAPSNLLARLLPGGKAKRPADLIVLSDLHLAEGKVGGTWSRREQFRVHRQFDQMVSYLLKRQKRAGRKLKIVLNGDIFDFLLVVNPPQGQRFRDNPGPQQHHSAKESVALQKLQRIGRQHDAFFKSLRRVVSAGHEVVFTVGNHDQELHYPAVQSALRKLVTGQLLLRRNKVKIEPWFHLHGDVLMEHGHRYDPLNNVDHPLSPYRKDAKGDTRLRPAAGTYLVTQWANRLRETMPEGLKIRGAKDVWRLMRRFPPELSRFVGFLAALSSRTGPIEREEARALVQAHRKAIGKIADNRKLLSQLNTLRKANGQTALDKRELYTLLRQFDNADAKPYLRTKKRRSLSSKLRHALRMLLPSNLLPWLNTRRLSTLRGGMRMGLKELSNVMVTGHTHHPFHYTMTLDGSTKQLANSGTWAHTGGTKNLTFVDIRQLPGKTTTVRLRRWDADKRRPTLQHKAKRRVYKPGRFPSNRKLH